jgi:hypothetical protein
MARSERQSNAPDIERTFKEFIEQAAQRQIMRAFGTSSPAAELREMRKALTRLERRVDALTTRISGRPPRAPGARRGPGRPATHTTCTVPGCDNPHYAKGLCSRCYQRARRTQGRAKAVAEDLPVTSSGAARKKRGKKAAGNKKKNTKKKSTRGKATGKKAAKSSKRARSSKRRTTRKTGR